MDFFGIGQAMEGCTRTYFLGARRTGRTTQLAQSLKNGDRVIFMCNRDADDMRRRCEALGTTINCVVAARPNDMLAREPVSGRCIVDHRWVEDMYTRAISNCRKEIMEIEQMMGRREKPFPRHTGIDADKWRV